MGHTRSSNFAFKILFILSILISTTVSEKAAPGKEGSPPEPIPEQKPTEKPTEQQTQQQQAPPTPVQEELIIEVLNKPTECERLSKRTDILTVHYIAKLAATGEEIGNSRLNDSKPYEFQLGAGAVITGWDEGFKNMCTKEIRKLTVPPHMGYGIGELEKIPANSTLIFEVELLKIADGGKIRSTFEMMDANDDNKVTIEEMSKYMSEEIDQLGWDIEHHELVVKEVFKEDDKNNDGVITHEEFSGPKHLEL